MATGDGKTGYMMTKYLKMEHAVQATDDLSDGDQEDVEIPSYTIRYIDPGDGSEVPGYAAPSTEANVLFFYPAGYRVVVHSIENGWAFISMDTVGRYVQTKYLSLTNPTDTEHSSNDLEGSGLARTMVIQTGNSGKLNLRASPGGKLVERYPNGTQVTVLSQANKNGWAQVKIQGKSGYVQVKYLADSNAAADEPASSTKVSASPSAIEQRFVHTGNSGKLNLRRTAGGKLIDRYPNGTPVTVHSVSGAWAYVTIGGKQGFVMEKYLSANAAAADQSVSQEAPAAESSAPIDEPSLQTPSAGDGWRIQTGNSGKLNLRTEPNRNAPTLDRYPNGTAVRIIRPRGAWAYVQIGRQYGYVMTKYLAP
ncbi:MAG: SH3 domain-containing protein [Clostridia bacterium]|nr:SH3 domain-containing protein [Clostridia bacterium]